MSSAALQVQALENLLNERAQGRGRLDCLAMTFFARVAEVVSTPWTLAANFDFAYPRTTGERPSDLKEWATSWRWSLSGGCPGPYPGNGSHQLGEAVVRPF